MMIKDHKAAKKTAKRYVYEAPLVVQPDLSLVNLSRCYLDLHRQIKYMSMVIFCLSITVMSYAIPIILGFIK